MTTSVTLLPNPTPFKDLPPITDADRQRVLQALANGGLAFRGLCIALRAPRVHYPWGHRGHWLEGRGLVRRSLVSCMSHGLVYALKVQRPRRRDRLARTPMRVFFLSLPTERDGHA